MTRRGTSGGLVHTCQVIKQIEELKHTKESLEIKEREREKLRPRRRKREGKERGEKRGK